MNLDRQECLRLLATVSVGRVVYTDGALPAIEPVTFSLTHAHVVFRVPSGVSLRALYETVLGVQADNAAPQIEPDWTVNIVGTGACSRIMPPPPPRTVLPFSPRPLPGSAGTASAP